MKALISFTTLLIFTHALTNHMITTEAKEGSNDPVSDSDGEKVQVGQSYYIVPAFFPGGGGLYLLNTSSINTTSCRYAVGQERVFTNLGDPLTFSPAEEGGAVLQSTDLNIAFSPKVECGPSVWKVDEYDPNAGKYFITTGGVEGNPGPETVSNWFKIEKIGADFTPFYKITFCPLVCKSCAYICSDVGVFVQDVSTRRLALLDNPLIVAFRKASED